MELKSPVAIAFSIDSFVRMKPSVYFHLHLIAISFINEQCSSVFPEYKWEMTSIHIPVIGSLAFVSPDLIQTKTTIIIMHK